MSNLNKNALKTRKGANGYSPLRSVNIQSNNVPLAKTK